MTLVLNGTTGVSAVDGSASTPAIQGNDTNTGVFFPAADTVAIATNGTERVRVNGSGDFQFNSGYGSVATAYACRAWVNFNGTGTVAIRASGNVSSITDNGNGDFTVNFTTAMPDANYSALADLNGNGSLNSSWMAHAMFSSAHSTTVAPTTSAFRFCTFHPGNLVNQDSTYNLVSVFR